MLTEQDQAWAHVWRAAHDVAAREWPRVQSGLCQQPGLAATLAIFARDIALAEREACAKIAENWLGSDRLVAVSGKPGAEAGLKLVRAEAQQIATAIRARSNSNE